MNRKCNKYSINIFYLKYSIKINSKYWANKKMNNVFIMFFRSTLIRNGLTEFSCLQSCDYLQAVIPNFECSLEVLCANFSDVCCSKLNYISQTRVVERILK